MSLKQSFISLVTLLFLIGKSFRTRPCSGKSVGYGIKSDGEPERHPGKHDYCSDTALFLTGSDLKRISLATDVETLKYSKIPERILGQWCSFHL
jgi:hypothetical protein